MKNILLALAVCGGLMLAACGGATKPAQEAKKDTKPAATPAAAEKPKAEAEKPKTDAEGGGETLRNPDAGVQFTVPAGWKKEEKDGALTVVSPDEGVALSIVVSPAESLDKAIDGATGELDKLIKNPKIDQKAEPGEVNGLKTVSMNGTGELDGKPVVWDLSIVASKKPLLVISIGAPESIEKHGKDYKKMVDSIKPL